MFPTTEEQYIGFVKSLPGAVIEGWHKASGRPGHVMALEVTGVAKIPTRFGEKTYVVGTRLDGDNAGRINTVRLDAFVPSTITVKPAEGFKPLDLTGWYIRPQTASQESVNHFAWLEKLDTPEDIEFALIEGCQPLSQYMIADKVAKPARKARKAAKPAEQPAA